jgi:hypothetical protein
MSLGYLLFVRFELELKAMDTANAPETCDGYLEA